MKPLRFSDSFTYLKSKINKNFICGCLAKFKALEKSRQIIVLAIALAVLWLFIGLFFSPTSRMDSLEVNPAKVIYVESLADDKIKFITFHATAEAEKKVKLIAPNKGVVFEIKVNKGDHIKKHQELAAVSPVDYYLILSAAENQVRELEEAIGSEEIISRKLAADLTRARGELDKARHYSKNMVIRSPINGRVEASEVSLGDMVNHGQELFLVVDSEQIKCKIFLSRAEYSQLKNDAEAKIIDSSGTHHSAKVRFMSKAASRKNLSYEVEVVFDNQDEKIREGEAVDVLLSGAGLRAHKLPLAALVINDDGELGLMIYNHEDSKAYFKKVQVIDQDNQNIWVSDLDEKANVIIMGQSSIENGAKVVAKIK